METKQKHIWIVNYYCNPPDYVTNERHLQFAHYLQKSGYKVTIFSAGYLHYRDIDLVGQEKIKKIKYGEYNFCHIKVHLYQGNGLGRMYSINKFARDIYRNRKKLEKPDIIYHNMHAPFDYPICLCAKKLKARYIAEEWDLWPEYFVTFGLISANNPAMKWAYSKERKMFEYASNIVYSFAGGIDYLKEKKWLLSTGGKIDEKKVIYINNGFCLSEIEYH